MEPNPGGFGLGRIGPVTEGLVVWIVGIGAARARRHLDHRREEAKKS